MFRVELMLVWVNVYVGVFHNKHNNCDRLQNEFSMMNTWAIRVTGLFWYDSVHTGSQFDMVCQYAGMFGIMVIYEGHLV